VNVHAVLLPVSLRLAINGLGLIAHFAHIAVEALRFILGRS
jgi:hypothetical protein